MGNRGYKHYKWPYTGGFCTPVSKSYGALLLIGATLWEWIPGQIS